MDRGDMAMQAGICGLLDGCAIVALCSISGSAAQTRVKHIAGQMTWLMVTSGVQLWYYVHLICFDDITAISPASGHL